MHALDGMTYACTPCRFTLDELEGFLETAKECIPGVKEAVVAANNHKAHQVTLSYTSNSDNLLPFQSYCLYKQNWV